MSSSPKILFVCFADSSHSQSWFDLLAGSGLEARAFAVPSSTRGRYPPLPWSLPTYLLRQPGEPRPAGRTIWLLPKSRLLRPLVDRLAARLDLNTLWLKRILLAWKPDIVHSLSFNKGARYAWMALQTLPRQDRPRWVISSWGTEINFGVNDPEARPSLETYLRECDGFISDCRRDYGNALKLGMAAEKVAFDFPIPVTGGVALGNVPLAGLAQRKVILVPKAYEGLANKTLPIIEAFRLCENELKGYEIHLYMCDPDVRSYWHQMPEWLRKMGHCHGAVPKQELIQAMGQARVMIATSISEGTPNVMLEAMAAGAFPIMSPIDSVLEWIEDGKNGLLAHALFPNQIADSLKRALQDDALLEQAMQPNRALVAERADRERIRPAVIEYYRRLAGA